MSHEKALSSTSLKLFFDESGKKERPNLMGGLLIPTSVYTSPDLDKYTQMLRDGTLKLHWKEYTGYSKMRDDITHVIDTLSKYAYLIKMNVINYNYTALKGRNTEFEPSVIQQMIYTKLPERIFYGLLRNFGKDIKVETDVYIEKSTEYESLQLDQKIQDLLNAQSLYRGEQFKIVSSQLIPKGQEIGVELTDLLLGIIRHIISNAPIHEGQSKGLIEKNELTVTLLQKERFYQFLSTIKYYEWNNTKELKEVNFEDYLKLFISNNCPRFFQ